MAVCCRCVSQELLSLVLSEASRRPWLDGVRSDLDILIVLGNLVSSDASSCSAPPWEPGRRRPNKQTRHRGRPSPYSPLPDHQWPQTSACAYPGQAEANIPVATTVYPSKASRSLTGRIGTSKRRERSPVLTDKTFLRGILPGVNFFCVRVSCSTTQIRRPRALAGTECFTETKNRQRTAKLDGRRRAFALLC